MKRVEEDKDALRKESLETGRIREEEAIAAAEAEVKERRETRIYEARKAQRAKWEKIKVKVEKDA